MQPPPFIPGLQLCGDFYHETIRPIINSHYPNVSYAAALIGHGSEVLGFDDAMSTDHHWGPRLMLFLLRSDHDQIAAPLGQILAQELPYTFHGYSTHYSAPDPNDNGVQHPVFISTGPVNHRVEILTAEDFFADYFGLDLQADLTPAIWLTLPQQKLRTFTAGAVYHDGIGLEAHRERLRWYPHDVWIYLLAAAWTRLGQEEHLMGRAGIRGDEVGSALIGARLVRDLMRLCFLMDRQYAPYPKWFGTAFQKLDCAAELSPHLQAALTAATWKERENHLVPAYEAVARRHNQLGLTDPLPEKATRFWGRPFRVMAFHGFADHLLEQVSDPAVKKIASGPLIGSLDQFSDNTDLLAAPALRPAIEHLYD